MAVFISPALLNTVWGASKMLIQGIGYILSICVCFSTFSLFKLGGFSNWKSGKKSDKAAVILGGTPLVLILAVVVGLNFYTSYLFSQIEKASPFLEKQQSYQTLLQINILNEKEANKLLQTSLEKNVPDLDSLFALAEDDFSVFIECDYPHIPFLVSDYIRDAIINSPTDTFLQKAQILSKKLHDKNIIAEGLWKEAAKYKGDIPLINKDSSENTGKWGAFKKNEKKYIVLCEDENGQEWDINIGYMLACIPNENLPSQEAEVDVIIAVTNNTYQSGIYYNGKLAYDRKTYIRAYDYKSGNLLKTIDEIHTVAPDAIEKSDTAGYAEFPDKLVEKAISNFFR
jgi:hypothetical protein